MTDKPALRAELRARRRAFVANGKPAIPLPAALNERIDRGVPIASYAPTATEADPAAIVAAARDALAFLYLPWFDHRDAAMDFRQWDRDAPLAPGPYGPQPESPFTGEPAIILTPLVGFDAARNRLGQGAGHYDRIFARFPDAFRVGIAFSVQQVDALPTDPWDVPLHMIVTEKGIL